MQYTKLINGQHFAQHIFSVLILLGMILAVQSQHESKYMYMYKVMLVVEELERGGGGGGGLLA